MWTFRVLNSHQWSLAKQVEKSCLKSAKTSSSQTGWGNKPTEFPIWTIVNTKNVDALKTNGVTNYNFWYGRAAGIPGTYFIHIPSKCKTYPFIYRQIVKSMPFDLLCYRRKTAVTCMHVFTVNPPTFALCICCMHVCCKCHILQFILPINIHVY